jgi:hypothetical protein
VLSLLKSRQYTKNERKRGGGRGEAHALRQTEWIVLMQSKMLSAVHNGGSSLSSEAHAGCTALRPDHSRDAIKSVIQKITVSKPEHQPLSLNRGA